MHASNSAQFPQTCSTNKMVEAYFDRLPCEILQNIALMLPFSSIKQLRCSSKFWYNLLTDPKFIDLHLTRALEKPHGYLFSAPLNRAPLRLWSDKKACYFVEQSEGHLSNPKIFEYSSDFNDHEIWNRFQSSGGLMCAYSSQSCCFRIFNPHITEEVQVPRDPKFKKWNFLHFIFSYSPSIKEYKILKMGFLYSGSPVVEICTLGFNIWRELQNVPNRFWDNEYICCQGNPFWIKDSDLHFFDLVSEKFHVIPGPPRRDRDHLNYVRNTCYNFMRGMLINMGDTVGYVHNYILWVLKDKTQGTWINKYDFSIPPLYKDATPIGTSENGHLFGYIYDSTNVFSHDMGCRGFRITEMNLADFDEEQLGRVEYMAPHVRSFVSPVRIMNMGKRLNHKKKRVLDTLKLDYDATEDDLFDRMYEFMEAYEKSL